MTLIDESTMPIFFSLCMELGPSEVFDRYFDEEMNVMDGAPDGLAEEIARERKRTLENMPEPPQGASVIRW